MIGLDTNIILRYLLRDDPQQSAQVTRLIEQELSAKKPGFVSVVVTAEIVWNLLSNYEFSRHDLLDAINALLSIESLVLQNDMEVSAALKEMRSSPISFPDALISALSQTAGCTTTYTFDRKASRLPGFTLLS